MIASNRRMRRRFLGAVAAAVTMTAAPAPTSAAPGADPRIFPVNSKPYGASYQEWSARHWQWLYSLPVDAHPLFDTADCSEGQKDHVWFLGGTYTTIESEPGVFLGKADRTCTMPSGTAVFFPIVDVECATIEGNGSTDAELRDCANFFADAIVPESLALEIDGMPVANLPGYRVESPLFTFGPLPENNVLQSFGFDAPEGATSLSVSDGVFVMLRPLSVGVHTIAFHGEVDLSPDGPLLIQDIEYTITVVPRGRYPIQ